MKVDSKLKIVFGLLFGFLLTTLLFKLKDIPGGMILSGLYLGGMMIVAIIGGCLIVAGVLRLIFKRTSYQTIFYIMTSISFLAFHYKIYSPTLTIIVPNDYIGEINLVLSNTNDNILKVDSNGVGYLTEWTFDKTYLRPIVKQTDGKNLDKNLVGFDRSAFFGRSKYSYGEGKYIESLSFEIVPDAKVAQKQYYPNDLATIVNRELVLFSNTDKYTSVQTATRIDDTATK